MITTLKMHTPLRPAKLIIAAATLSLLAGCGHNYGGRVSEIQSFNSGSVEKRHPIVLAKKPVAMAVPISRRGGGLSPEQKLAVQAFIGDYRRKGEGHLTVVTPAGGSSEGAGYQTANEVRELAESAGIPASAISVEAYSGGGSQPPVKLSFVNYEAEGPECGLWPDNLARNSLNEHYTNYGCAQQHNLAAMLDNPRDLKGPRPETARFSERRDVIWLKYITGQSTIAEKKSEEKANALSAVGN